MIWLMVLGLAGWVVMQTFRLSELQSRIGVLERRLLELRDRFDMRAQFVEPGDPAPSSLKPTATPNPSPTLARRVVDPSVAQQPQPIIPAAVVPPAPKGPPQREVIRAWLEENGLAWAGGAALALGGLFLVAYAAQRGTFTPPFRIGAAVVVGALMLGASEWLRRSGGHALAAAVAAGAGAATLYGAAWASYALYGLIGVAVAAPLLAMSSLGLLALAFRHGEALAILALAGGFLAPAVTGIETWSTLGLTTYLGALTVTGYGVAAARRWGLVGMITLAGTAVWALLGLLSGGPIRVATLAVGPVVLAYLAHEWRRRRFLDPSPAKLDAIALLPNASFVVAALLLGGLWLDWSGSVAPAALGAMALAGLSAFGVRRGLIYPPLQLAAYALCAGVVLWGWSANTSIWEHTFWAGALLVAVTVSGVAHAFGREGADARWAGGAAGAALLLATTTGSPGPWIAWTPEAASAVLLLIAAAILNRASKDPRTALSSAIWIWTSGAAALAALNEALDPRVLPLATAVFALAVAVLHAKLRWRGFAAVTLAASLAALTALVSPLMFKALQAEQLHWAVFAGVSIASAAMIFAAAWTTARAEGSRATAEALTTGAIVVTLAGAFLLLRPWGPAGGIDPFLEASLRTLLILVGGLTAALATPVVLEAKDRVVDKVLPAAAEELYSALVAHGEPGLIGRWRGQALLLVGLVHGLVFQMIVFNPLLAGWKPAVAGPPVLDSLALGFLAPAGLLAAATLARVSPTRILLAIYAAGAALFAFVWQMMEARRLFQGADLTAGLDYVGRAEGTIYALLMLVAAGSTLWLGDLAARRRLTISPLAAEITLVGRLSAWGALALAILAFALASPWWGSIGRPLAKPVEAIMLVGLYGFGAVAAFGLMAPAQQAGDRQLTRFARLTGITVTFAFVNLAVRWGFRGLDMRPDLRDASLETWAFSALWGVFGFSLLVFGAARRDSDLRGVGLAMLMITLAKIFLFDMSRLDGVVRAASFLAVGALLLAAAVMVRRLGGSEALPFRLGAKADDG